MKKFISILLITALTSSLALTGCSSNKNDSDPAVTQKNESSESKIENKEEITLSMIDIIPSPQREEFFNSMNEGFNKEFPHITVEYGSTPYEEAQSKLTTMGAAKDLPDIVIMHDSYKFQFAPSGWLVDLSDRIEKDGYMDKFNPIITKLQWGAEKETLGGIFTMPDGLMTNGCFVREDWIKEAGIDMDELRANWTWDRYIQLQEELTDPEKNRYGSSYRAVDMAGWNVIEMYLCSFSGGYSYDENGQFILNTPENAERLQKFIEIYQKGHAPKDSIGWGFAETVDNFTGGLAGTLLNDIEVVATCMDRMEDEEWAVLSYPRSTVDDGIYSYVGAVYNYGVSAFSEYQDETWEYLKYISRPENNMKYSEMLTMLPAVKDIGDNEFFGENGPVLGFMDQITYDKFAYYAGATPVNVNIVSQTIIASHQKLLQGKITSADFLAIAEEQFESQTTKYLKDNPGLSLQKVRTLK